MFVIFGGLPGSGKSTIAQALASRTKAVYLRIDSIEQAIRAAEILPPDMDVGAAGYMTGYRIAADNLALGQFVIADSVNPIEITRAAFRDIAAGVKVSFIEVEVMCSDQEMHRHRVENRPSTVEGLKLPSWDDVVHRHYEPWDSPHLILDSARLSVDESIAEILAVMPDAARKTFSI
ncbi:AAA family ATPase [Rhizobium tumorigenes]|uniref:AAA family ATPase n=1 Tax=Rhizobium tumorigenes TaxID=2041385 RepID=UPI00241E3936|nr:AAA family ATPase [Rhizobium tumorigenes]WFS01916.1 AAA family ATPase [Rhizobium tumorigenes]